MMIHLASIVNVDVDSVSSLWMMIRATAMCGGVHYYWWWYTIEVDGKSQQWGYQSTVVVMWDVIKQVNVVGVVDVVDTDLDVQVADSDGYYHVYSYYYDHYETE